MLMSLATRSLIADDQPDILEAFRLLLKAEGYQIDAADSPRRRAPSHDRDVEYVEILR
jgi:CheY-like chemotaxis protein